MPAADSNPVNVKTRLVAGFTAGLGIWTGATWARTLAGLIVVATVLAALAFAFM